MLNGAPVGFAGAAAGVGVGFLAWLITNNIALAIILGLFGGIGVMMWVLRWMKESTRKS